VYVRLLDEGVDVYRPVTSIKITETVYELDHPEGYDPDDESWEFLPGSKVRVERKLLEGESSLVVVGLFSDN